MHQQVEIRLEQQIHSGHHVKNMHTMKAYDLTQQNEKEVAKLPEEKVAFKSSPC